MSRTVGRIGLVSELLRRGISPNYADDGILVVNQKCIRPNGVLDLQYSRRHDEADREIPEDLLIQPGDILINSTGTGTLGRSCVVREVETRMTWDSHVTLVRPRQQKVNYSYLGRVIESEEQQLIELSVGSTNQIELSRGTVFNLEISLPPLETQQRIADYLDRETAEIDAAVADLDRYVELLKLRVRTLIKQQLSGDHPQAKMGLLADAIIGITYSPNDVVAEGGIKVYRSGNVQNSRIDRQDMLAVDVEVPPHLRFQEGDILMCSRNGSANLVGKNAIVAPEDLGQTWGAFMTVIRSDLNRYLFWFFRSPQFDAYRGLFSTSTINQLTTGILNRIPVPLPPEGRRNEIVKTLDLEVGQIDSLIAESTRLRDLLLKRRSVLITEVVTGRKQV